MVSMVLAGCASGGDVAPVDDGPDGPTVTEDTGAIDGIVLSEDLLPIKGATVALKSNLSDTRTTGADGKFSFSNVPPGEDFVLVSKLGFADSQQRVEIVAGEVTTIEFRLPAQVAEGVPYRITFGPIPGRFFCGFSVEGALSGPCKIIAFSDSSNPVEQSWQDVSDGEENIFEFREAIKNNRSTESDTLSSLLVEVTWEPVAASANILQMTLEDVPESEGARNLSEPLYSRAEGPAPLRLEIEPGVKDPSGEIAMPVGQEGFLVGVFPGATEDNPMTIYTSQNFEVWITLAYNGPLPSEFTALGDV